MRKLILVLGLTLCVSSAVAQNSNIAMPNNKATAPRAEDLRAEFMNAKYWSKIGEQKDPLRGFTLYSRNLLPNPEGQIELWVKIVPSNLEQFNKHYEIDSNAS